MVPLVLFKPNVYTNFANFFLVCYAKQLIFSTCIPLHSNIPGCRTVDGRDSFSFLRRETRARLLSLASSNANTSSVRKKCGLRRGKLGIALIDPERSRPRRRYWLAIATLGAVARDSMYQRMYIYIRVYEEDISRLTSDGEYR